MTTNIESIRQAARALHDKRPAFNADYDRQTKHARAILTMAAAPFGMSLVERPHGCLEYGVHVWLPRGRGQRRYFVNF